MNPRPPLTSFWLDLVTIIPRVPPFTSSALLRNLTGVSPDRPPLPSPFYEKRPRFFGFTATEGAKAKLVLTSESPE